MSLSVKRQLVKSWKGEDGVRCWMWTKGARRRCYGKEED
jgi:hypothetical protein